MRVQIDYGKRGLTLDLPGEIHVLQRPETPALLNETAAIREALRHPLSSPALRELVRPHDTVAIVFSDITRPMPNDRVLPVLLDELSHVAPENITLINALGTHRPNTPDELRTMLGDRIVDTFHIVQHDAWDDATLVKVGTSERGYPLRVNRLYLESDVRILTGFVEPHFFAGFSGGPKAVLPGVAGIDTIMRNHDYTMLADPGATWLQTEGNPVYQEIERCARMTEPTFILNVTLNSHRHISAVYAGEMLPAHKAARQFVRENACLAVDRPFDVVVTSNGGYPLDLNLYQAVKGMSAATRIVRPGGAIILAAECWDGLPEHGKYAEFLRNADSPQALLEHIATLAEPVHDQWQAQIQAQVQLRADVYVYSDGLTDEQIRSALLLPCRDIEATVGRLVHEKGPRVAVLPEGPFSVPTLVHS